MELMKVSRFLGGKGAKQREEKEEIQISTKG